MRRILKTAAPIIVLIVGPEQNYNYIAALKPRMAIIFDIRRGNLDIQLMYKAIFELSKDRADFISMLFSKPRPAGLTSSASARHQGMRRQVIRTDDVDVESSAYRAEPPLGRRTRRKCVRRFM